ncbi:hypothetical protein CEV33_3235 [Brucella grignonensis]|uniref:Uncharacterized protein n=1 Tax=Brucella grignonensis TaxID=94627 RepID=A0A256F0U7_9HYPH|nr:hypothetical protein CEV33_3235 [Brucella grignonensis]
MQLPLLRFARAAARRRADRRCIQWLCKRFGISKLVKLNLLGAAVS